MAIEGCPPLHRAYRSGLQALRARDRRRVAAQDSRSLTGSVDVDQSLRADFPNAPRWDYAIGFRRPGGEKVLWVEVHPASTSEVATVLAKLGWLRAWLKSEDAKSLASLSGEMYWIASGAVHITRTSPEYRRLAQSGIVLRERIEIRA